MPDDDEPTAWDRAMADHEAQLKTGTRVRIMPGEGCHHHGEQEAGVTGIIIDMFVVTPGVAVGHPYVVLFDRPLWITKSYMPTWVYAAGELTPIPWPTPEEVVADVLRSLAPDEGPAGDGRG